MKTLETERLILRKYAQDDFDAVHSYASSVENTIYMPFGPNTEEQTHEFLDRSIKTTEENLVNGYIFAIVLKETGKLIGGCEISPSGNKAIGDEASLGWIIHRDYWKQGYGTEMGKELLRFGFEELNLHRITANCDAENYGSYRAMERIGMRREGTFFENRPPNKLTDKKYSDGFLYAILKDEWETQKEMAYYNSLPVVFDDFIDVPELSDGLIYLVCTEKHPANPEKKHVPGYNFMICKNGEKIGALSLRIGYTDGLYFGGQIGYNIDEKYRGNGYAGRACRLILPVAKAHGMIKLLITNDHKNAASKRVCEKLGARFIRVARLPEWNDLYQSGGRFENIFEWSIK